MSISIHLLDDDLEFSKLLLELIGNDPLFEIRGHSTCLSEARHFASTQTADIHLVDLSLPDGSGIEFISLITQPNTQAGGRTPKAIAMSTISNDKHVIGSLMVGASGFICKSEPPQAFTKSIISTATVGGYLSTNVSKIIIEKIQESAHTETLPDSKPAFSPPQANVQTFTPKEFSILKLIESGRSTKLIADELGISYHTVNQHLRSIYNKLNARNKMEAVIKARSFGLL